MKVWRIKKGEDRRFLSGHPWVFSNELTESPKGCVPGEPVELRDVSGAFLARGYGNPSSLIAFRALSRDPSETDILSEAFFVRRLERAWALRSDLGLVESGLSHRWVHGESDGVAGLILDRYVLGEPAALGSVSECWSLQLNTAGIDRAWPELERALRSFARTRGQVGKVPVHAVVSRDTSSRVLEGLEKSGKSVLFLGQEGASPGSAPDWAHARARVRPGGVSLDCDLLGGQKTGLFLDQAENIALLSSVLQKAVRGRTRPFRLLDLFCYVGQWSVHLAKAIRESAPDLPIEVTLVDASEAALERAAANLKRLGLAQVEIRTIAADVMEWSPPSSGADEGFDCVIADPPAFVKKRKDLAQGLRAYSKLARLASRLCAPGGWLAFCSCSGLLPESEFERALAQNVVSARAGGDPWQWLARGGQAVDHPVMLSFPEGRYLKCWVGRRSAAAAPSRASRAGFP